MKNRKKNTKLILLLLLICITLGYAALRTGLNINGVANVSSSSWSVYFSNYQMSNATNITPTTEPVIVGTTTTSISYEVDLDVPGDIYEFSVEVVNGGTMDANISLVSKYDGAEIGPGNTIPEYIEYTVTDGNGAPIVDNHRLNHGDREIVKVFVKYKDDDPSVLPTQDAPGLSFDIEIEATKAEKLTDRVLYTTHKDNYILINQAIPNTITTYSTPAEAMAAFGNKPVYLKHIIRDITAWTVCEDDSDYCTYEVYSSEGACLNALESWGEGYICKSSNVSDAVVESYVGFIITDALKAQWKEDNCSGDISCETVIDNLVNGTYYLRGGVDESSSAETPIYNSNKNIIKAAFNYANQPEDICEEDSPYFRCWGFNLDVRAGSNGYVKVDDDSGDCTVALDNVGFSFCQE